MLNAKTIPHGRRAFPRIDSLKPGTVITLRFHCQPGYVRRDNSDRAYDERAIFDGVQGVGNERMAGFWTWDRDGHVFLWEAYRFRNGWAYGSSAEKLQLVAVHE